MGSSYTLDQAQKDIASLRGQFTHMLAFIELLQLQVDTQITGPDASVWTSTGVATDSWHSATLLNTWTGSLSYKRTLENNLWIFGVIQPGATSPTTTVMNVPAAYQPKNGSGVVTTRNSIVFDSTASVVHNSAADTTYRIAGTYSAATNNVVVNFVVPLVGP